MYKEVRKNKRGCGAKKKKNRSNLAAALCLLRKKIRYQ